MRFANAQVLDWLDSLMAVRPRAPIVVIGPMRAIPAPCARMRAFHGPPPRRRSSSKFGILSAFYLPGKAAQEAGLFDSITR
jgi:hypothetical protein